MAKHRVVLIDGSALVYRAFFAIPSAFTTSAGVPTNATYGFAQMFQKLLAGRTPTYGAVIFDAPGGSFRTEIYSEYKAQRPRMAPELKVQLPWIERLVEAHDYPTLKIPGVEADDVIGTLTRLALEAGHEVRIVTGDKDFAQLIGDDVRLQDTVKDVTYDAELARRKWGVGPEQFIDYLALMGDTSDNIPGVPGVGQKTAAKLLAEHGTLEAILAAAEGIKGRAGAMLREHADQARMSQRLATIDQRVPLTVGLEDLRLPPVDAARVDALYRELEFYSLLTDQGPSPVEALDADYAVVSTGPAVDALLDGLGDAPVSVTLLHDPPSYVSAPLVGVALGRPGGWARYLPFGDATAARIGRFLSDPAQPKILHNARDAWTLCARHGVDLRGVVADVQLESFLVDPTGLIPHRLDQLARHFLQRPLAPAKEVTGAGKKEQPFSALALDALGPWACHLADATAEMAAPIRALVEEREQQGYLFDVALPLAEVLGRMQLTGITVDTEVLAQIGEDFRARRAELEAQIHAQAGRAFNIGSLKQLGAVLFEELGLPIVKRTKTGYSTDVAVMEKLARKHPIAADVLAWRSLDKLVNTYTKVLREAVIPQTGRVHCTFQQTSGASGRLITTDPDLQRTPIRTPDGKKIRAAFVPQPGWVLISADWSQIELRLLAHVTGDPLLVDSFARGLDVHRRTAAEIFDVAPEDVTAEQRNTGKTVNFATIYGQGATALGQSLGITRDEAKAIIGRYFERYAGVRDWLATTRLEADAEGFVTTLLGRKRFIPELRSNNFADRSYGERVATNTPIQGSAADLCKLAMLQIARRFGEAGLQTRMLLQIHDELVFEAPPAEVAGACAIIRSVMEGGVPLKVPLVVDVGTGQSWLEAH